jgi:hypothetical protein
MERATSLDSIRNHTPTGALAARQRIVIIATAFSGCQRARLPLLPTPSRRTSSLRPILRRLADRVVETPEISAGP